jgi:uncharacterized membrane protein
MLRMERFAPHAIEMQGDEHWRWGMYYFNPSDPALFIQKRSVPGYTFNFARTQAWLMMVLGYGFLVYAFINALLHK